MQNTSKKMMHIDLSKEDIGKYVFLPGCVERVELIASHLDNPRFVARKGEFYTFLGELEGVKVSVTSTGIGGPSASIAIEELKQLGAHTMVRIGSCASTSPLAKIGHVMIPCGAVRMEGTGNHYLPIEFPAVPDYALFKHFKQAAIDSAYPFNTGVTITKDSFYTEVSPETKPVYQELAFRWNAYIKSGATNTSMECAPLFLMGATLGIRTASVMICATNNDDYSNDDANYPRDWEKRAIEVSIEGMRNIIKDDIAKDKNHV